MAQVNAELNPSSDSADPTDGASRWFTPGRYPNNRILATSREALNIAGEIAWPVPPLSMIDPKQSVNAAALQTSEAARLFLDRATAAHIVGLTNIFAPAADNDMFWTACIATIQERFPGLP